MEAQSESFRDENQKARKQPVYKRQRFILDFINKVGGNVSATDLQKLLFLYLMREGNSCYSFVPYKFGAYSFQLAQDIKTLTDHGFLTTVDKKIYVSLKGYTPSGINIRAIDGLRGTMLIQKVYDEFPYYAINSKIAKKIMDETALQKIQDVRDKLNNTAKTLFTIGYEGVAVEHFVNILIKNNIGVLCDVRKNPTSRKYGFSKNMLRHIVDTIGIKYVHFPGLGIESERRKVLQNQDDYNDLFEEYKEKLTTRQDELQYIYNIILKQSRIALMCFEKDPGCCHRKQVKDYIVEHYKVKGVDL